MKPSVTFIQRRPHRTGNFSLEFIFEDLRRRMGERCQSRVMIAKWFSGGFLPRLAIALQAWRERSAVNHVTGDINFAGLLLAGNSTVLTVHDCGFLRTHSGVKKRLLKSVWLTLPVYRAHTVTTVSNAIREEVLRETGCPADKVVVIPNNVDSQFTFREGSFNFAQPRILQVGTAPNKNVPHLVAALNGLPCHLVIIGPVSSEIRGLLSENKISFEAHDRLSRTEMLRQYEDCDIVSFVSTYEGFGMPIVEGNATGRVVVTSNVGAMAEVAGDAACLVDPTDVESIRAGFNRVIQDETYRQHLIARGVENRLRFNGEEIAEKYLAVYRLVAAQSPYQ